MKETITNLLRQRPFQPFVIQLSNGETFEVNHQGMANMTKSSIVVFQPDSDSFDICSFLHIANVTANGSAVSES